MVSSQSYLNMEHNSSRELTPIKHICTYMYRYICALTYKNAYINLEALENKKAATSLDQNDCLGLQAEDSKNWIIMKRIPTCKCKTILPFLLFTTGCTKQERIFRWPPEPNTSKNSEYDQGLPVIFAAVQELGALAVEGVGKQGPFQSAVD